MKLQSIGLVRIVFIIALCLYSSFSFAQCPPDYPVDCGDSWCCLQTDITDCVVLIDSGLCISVESNTTTTTPDGTTTTSPTTTSTKECVYAACEETYECKELYGRGWECAIGCCEPTGDIGCPSTNIYGEHSEEVVILRHFRDSVLSQSPEGQEIIKLYYQWSPVIVEVMEEDEEFKEEVRNMIDRILDLINEETE